MNNPCTRWWIDDYGMLNVCSLEWGHTPECTNEFGWRYSETVEMV